MKTYERISTVLKVRPAPLIVQLGGSQQLYEGEFPYIAWQSLGRDRALE